jgi:hypothetical protein
MSARKTENGFVAWENCFVGTWRRNIRAKKLNDFSMTVLNAAMTAVQWARTDPAHPSVFLQTFSLGRPFTRQTVNLDTAAAT